VPNHLSSQTSPYLLQHKDNPVDWWPWGPEAFAEARRRDVPVLLSVGYAACHWCHVMAHESFESQEIAAIINAEVVAVKVDREERPDVDSVYMEITQAMTGSGGWPMTVFLTPDAQPFHAGTYFPPDRFADLVRAIGRTWREQKSEILEFGTRLRGQLQREPGPAGLIDAELLATAAAQVVATYDSRHGGFGERGPKFPPSMVLEWLLRHHGRTGDVAALAAVQGTCEAMARGGIYDQLAGGFSRYSVDGQWIVPHFEKMLYDNALLARVYLHLWRATGSELARRVCTETLDWMLAELLTEEGGFASALDADSADDTGSVVEGWYYTWRLEEVDPAWAQVLDVTPQGTFEHGRSVLQLRSDPPPGWLTERARLHALRDATRARPARDDKVVAAWNGLAVAALAEAGALLDRPDWLVAATRAAGLLCSVHRVDGRLRRVSRDGVVGLHAGVLEDHADVAEGLLALHQATGERRWLAEAGQLLEEVLTRFADPQDVGVLHDTAADAEVLITRPREESDNAVPAGVSAAAQALLTYGALTGSARHADAAHRVLARLAPMISGHPRFAGWGAAAAEAMLAGPWEVAVVGRPDLLQVARLGTSPGAVVVAGDSPLMADRPAGAAYPCRDQLCELPVTDAKALAELLGARC
jgi:uncharacterized protein YyaL (SSP411 family)